MKTKTLLTLVVALGATVLTGFAQNAGGPPQGGPGGQGGQMARRPQPALIKAIDANTDGVIDADEIANASTALKALDKNSDGKLTRDEYIGKMPGRPPQGGQGAPEGDGPQGPPPGE